MFGGKLEGKTALITGAGEGLGAAIASVYAKYGAKMCLVDNSPIVEETADRIRKEYNAEIITSLTDVRDAEGMKAAAEQTVERYGGLDILCCNAGVALLGDFVSFSDEDLDLHIDVNIKGAWNSCKAAIPYMLDKGSGSIVIASSVTGDMVADPGEAAYALTKSALVGLTKALATEYAGRGIRVNCTQLGYARTSMSERTAVQTNPADPESVFTEMARSIPMKRLARHEEVGELYAFLGSDESSYITGAQIVIDGAATIRESNMGV